MVQLNCFLVKTIKSLFLFRRQDVQFVAEIMKYQKVYLLCYEIMLKVATLCKKYSVSLKQFIQYEI